LAATLSVNAFARALSGLGVVGLLRMVVEILGATFVCGRNFGNLLISRKGIRIKFLTRNIISLKDPYLMTRKFETPRGIRYLAAFQSF